MGRDTDMSNINNKLRSLNVEVQGIYEANLAQEKRMQEVLASPLPTKSNQDARSIIDARSNFDGKSNIRQSEVDRKEDGLQASLQDSYYNDGQDDFVDDPHSSHQSDYGRRPKIAKPMNGSVTPAPPGGHAAPYDTIPSVKMGPQGRGTRSSQQSSQMDKRFSKNNIIGSDRSH